LFKDEPNPADIQINAFDNRPFAEKILVEFVHVSVINMTGRKTATQQFTTVIDDQMQREPIKPTNGGSSALCYTAKNVMLVNAMIVANG